MEGILIDWDCDKDLLNLKENILQDFQEFNKPAPNNVPILYQNPSKNFYEVAEKINILYKLSQIIQSSEWKESKKNIEEKYQEFIVLIKKEFINCFLNFDYKGIRKILMVVD